MLTPYEVELLRKCAKETAEVVREVLLENLVENKDAAQSDLRATKCAPPSKGGGRLA